MSKYLSDNNVQYKTMILTGQGQVSLMPNIAVIRLGVQTTGENLAEIQSENAQKSQAILQTLKRIGISDVKTFQYSIDKIYDYKNGQQVDRGYSVRNIIEIRMNTMDQVGRVIDDSVNVGANIVDLITFEVSNREFYYQQALNLAVINAIQKAKSISLNLGINADPIPVHITENSTMSIPFQQFQREVAATPIVPGDIRIEANVTVEFVY